MDQQALSAWQGNTVSYSEGSAGVSPRAGMLTEPEKAVKCTIKPGATTNKSASRDALQMSNSTHKKDRRDESEPSMEGFE